MNEKIIKLENDTYVKTETGIYKVVNDNNNDLKKKLELENYIEYLEKIIELINSELSKRDYSNMSLKEIIKESKKNKNTKLLYTIMSIFNILSSIIILIVLIASNFTVGSPIFVLTLPFVVPVFFRFYATNEKENDRKRKEKLKELEILLNEKMTELLKIETIVKREIRNVEFTNLNTYNRCIYNGFEQFEEIPEKGLTRIRKIN